MKTLRYQNVYKNKNFTTRDYECTNIVACVSDKKPNENWRNADENILDKLTPLYIENDIQYWGYL